MQHLLTEQPLYLDQHQHLPLNFLKNDENKKGRKINNIVSQKVLHFELAFELQKMP